MSLPQDPFMLMSLLNMKLRDGEFESLDDLLAFLGADKNEIERKLKEAGFEYIPEIRQFR